KELPARHKNLFFQRSESAFIKDVEEIKEDIPSLKDREIRYRLARIVASLGDAHTSLFIKMTVGIPFSLQWFEDGLFVMNTIKEYEDILYCKLVKINDHPIEKVTEVIKGVISHENEAQIWKYIPYYLTLADVLAAANIMENMEYGEFTFENKRGTYFSRVIESMSDLSQFKPIVSGKSQENLPRYQKLKNVFYDFEYFDEYDTLYFLYNSCRQIKDKPFKDFVAEMFDEIDKHQIKCLVIDLRNNGGGNSGIFAPFLHELKKRPHLNQKDKLFVILGRSTFSSAVLNAIQLQNQTEATFVGEPTGGKPNHFGEVKQFILPNSKLIISYSTKYFTSSKRDTDSFYPDVSISLSLDDYLANKDPALEWILNRPEERRQD
ncbi:peptidase S41, partial [Acidobacteriota bacterium]